MNDTIEENKVINGVTLGAELFRDLLIGAAIAAHPKEDLRSLNGVNIRVIGGEVKVTATDRFRAIIGETSLESGDLEELTIPLSSVKKIITALKSLPKRTYKPVSVNLFKAGDILTVSISAASLDSPGDSFSIYLPGANFPDPVTLENLWNSEKIALSEFSLNAEFLASFAKVPGSNKAGINKFTFHGENKPVTVEIPHDSIRWRGLLMPVRIK